MSQLNRQMRERNHELRIQLAKKKKEEEIDRQLELQVKLGLSFPMSGSFFLSCLLFDNFLCAYSSLRLYLPLDLNYCSGAGCSKAGWLNPGLT